MKQKLREWASAMRRSAEGVRQAAIADGREHDVAIKACIAGNGALATDLEDVAFVLDDLRQLALDFDWHGEQQCVSLPQLQAILRRVEDA